MTTDDLDKFYSEVVIPAFEELKIDLEKQQQKVNIIRNPEPISIAINSNSEEHFSYSIIVKKQAVDNYPSPQVRYKNKGKYHTEGGSFRIGIQNYTIAQITKDEIVQDFMTRYESHLQSR